jgi:hypothetical protein
MVANDNIHIERKSRHSFYGMPGGVSQGNIDNRENRDYNVSKLPKELGFISVG